MNLALTFAKAANIEGALALLEAGFAACGNSALWNTAVRTINNEFGGNAALVVAGIKTKRTRVGSFGTILLAAMKAAMAAKPNKFFARCVARAEFVLDIRNVRVAVRTFRATCRAMLQVKGALRSSLARKLSEMIAA